VEQKVEAQLLYQADWVRVMLNSAEAIYAEATVFFLTAAVGR